MSDEEIQKSFESNLPLDDNSQDVASYRKIFEIVSKEPVVKISNSFAEGVVKKIVVQKKREARRDIIWLTFGVVFLLVGLVVTAAFAGLQLELGFLKEMSGFVGIFVFGIVVILAFNWIEKRTLSKKLSR
jgi:uncharacterized YccA/Bax inhibitor family protein